MGTAFDGLTRQNEAKVGPESSDIISWASWTVAQLYLLLSCAYCKLRQAFECVACGLEVPPPKHFGSADEFLTGLAPHCSQYMVPNNDSDNIK